MVYQPRWSPVASPWTPKSASFLPLTASRGLTTPGEGAPTNSERLSNKLRTLTLFPGGEVGEGTHQFRTFSEHLPPPPPSPASPPPGRGVGEEAPTNSEHFFCACECLSRI